MPKSVAYVGTHGSGGPGDWITPPSILELAHDVLQGIELDPMSSQAAQHYVNARRFWTPAQDAFQQPNWKCRSLWMNPPYGRSMLTQAVNRFIEEWLNHHINKALILTNNITETAAGQNLLANCDSVWFPSGRLAFIDGEGRAVKNNTRGQMICAFGISCFDLHNAVIRKNLDGVVI